MRQMGSLSMHTTAHNTHRMHGPRVFRVALGGSSGRPGTPSVPAQPSGGLVDFDLPGPPPPMSQ
jgi:hypothetical protein